MVRGLVSFVINIGIMMALALVPAGISWRRGWAFFAVFAGELVLSMIYLWRANPAIFVARSKVHRGTKPWDMVMMALLFTAFFATFLVAGLDERFHGPQAPTWEIALGYALLTIGMIGCIWVEKVNKFAEPSVRVQTDRHHTVVTTGPYALVRHPMYVAAFVLMIGIPLALGSCWALVPAAISAIVLVVRTFLEDRMLHDELAGYKEYAARVRYRLIPGVW
jgi:protein-S-isoprenylcysteine O-methyltransferase Ste14